MNGEGRLNILNEENNETSSNSDYSTVYFTSDISSNGIMNIYQALNFEPQGSVIVLSHFKGHAMAGFGGASLIQRMESRNCIHTLEYGAQIGLGNLNYEIVNIDAR